LDLKLIIFSGNENLTQGNRHLYFGTMIASSTHEKGIKECANFTRLKENGKENQVSQESNFINIIKKYLHPIKLKFNQKF
jgi:hypothetical protein